MALRTGRHEVAVISSERRETGSLDNNRQPALGYCCGFSPVQYTKYRYIEYSPRGLRLIVSMHTVDSSLSLSVPQSDKRRVSDSTIVNSVDNHHDARARAIRYESFHGLRGTDGDGPRPIATSNPKTTSTPQRLEGGDRWQCLVADPHRCTPK